MKPHALLPVLLASCIAPTPGQPNDPGSSGQTALRYLRAIGDAAVRTEGTLALAKYAPDMFPLIDANGDKVITIEEVEAVALATGDPSSLTWLLIMAWETYKHRKD